MKNFSKKAICVFLAFIITVFSLVIYTATEAKFTTISGEFNYTYASQVLDLVNKERAKAGLGALVLDKTITAAAMIRSAECYVLFDHIRPNGDDCFTAFDYEYLGGENIAAGQRNPNSVMNSWMNSPGHRANILEPGYTKIGIGCFLVNNKDDFFRYYWTQDFSGGSTKDGYNPTGSVNVSVDISLTSGVQSVAGIAPTSISLNNNQLTLCEGETAFLEATVTPANASDLSVKWSSSDPFVADVYGGNVTAWNEGRTTVTAQTSNGLTAECVIKVVKSDDEPETKPWELPEIPNDTQPEETTEPTEGVVDETEPTIPTRPIIVPRPTVAPTEAVTRPWELPEIPENTQPETTPSSTVEPNDGNVICGDVNSDGIVNAVDRIVLTRFLAKWSGYEINYTASDVDLDGNVSSKDRIILTRHLAKWSAYTTLPHT